MGWSFFQATYILLYDWLVGVDLFWNTQAMEAGLKKAILEMNLLPRFQQSLIVLFDGVFSELFSSIPDATLYLFDVFLHHHTISTIPKVV